MRWQQWFTFLMSQWLVVFPWLLVGIFCSTALFILTPRQWWDKVLPRNAWWQLLYGLGLGLLLPVGQYGALPVLKRLLWQSGSASLAIAFWLTTASIQPLILWQLWRQLPDAQSIPLIYGGLSLLISLGMGAIFTAQRQQITHRAGEQELTYPAIARPSSYRLSSTSPTAETVSVTSKLTILSTSRQFRLSLAWQNMTQELLEWSTWLLCACMVMSLCQTLLSTPQGLTGNVFGVFGLGLLSSIDSFQNVSFLPHWFGDRSTGMSLSFLLIGTFFNIPTLMLLLNVFRLKAFIYITLLLGLSSLLLDFWLNFYVF